MAMKLDIYYNSGKLNLSKEIMLQYENFQEREKCMTMCDNRTLCFDCEYLHVRLRVDPSVSFKIPLSSPFPSAFVTWVKKQ